MRPESGTLRKAIGYRRSIGVNANGLSYTIEEQYEYLVVDPIVPDRPFSGRLTQEKGE